MNKGQMARIVSLGAKNWADWHGSQLHAHGLNCVNSDLLWSCPSAGPPIYLGAITLSEGNDARLYREISELAEARGQDEFILVDSWMALDLAGLGFSLGETEPWYLRAPAPLPGRHVPEGLLIERLTNASQLEQFERASVEGFGVVSPNNITTFQIHAAASLEDSRLHCYIGWVEGRAVSVSMAYISHGVAGVYGVATVPEFRRRGYGEAITWAAIGSGPSLPAVLEPTEIAASLYRRMGFAEVGRLRKWRYTGKGAA
jgi:ribosomal protein S18 acetylase RimI-like enzyme